MSNFLRRLLVGLIALVLIGLAPTPAASQATGPEGVIAVDIELDPNGDGFWVIDQLGRVYPQAGAVDYGEISELSQLDVGENIVAMSVTPTGLGYWLFSNRGQVWAFGDASLFGDLSELGLNQPVVASVSTVSGNGYYMVAKDGGVFAFGDAEFHGSTADLTLNRPVNGLVPSSSGGYWLVADDGGIFAFGDAPFKGSTGGISLNRPVIGAIEFSGGYLLVGADGGIFNFSDGDFLGSLASRGIASPASAVAGSATGDRYVIVQANGTVWDFTEAEANAGRTDGQQVASIALEPGPMSITPVYDFAGTRSFRNYRSSTSSAWPAVVPGIQDMRITSSADGTQQPSKWLPPDNPGAPLLVVLHSWSATYDRQISIPYARWADNNGWAMIAPNFRGINNNPSATGSELAIADVVDAIAFAVEQGADPDRVFALGYSGGGMMTLLMAGRHPELFAGVASWVPVYDLPSWYGYNVAEAPGRHYKGHIESSCGGAPVDFSAAYYSCKDRSPSSYLGAAREAGLPVYIATGIADDLVPPSDAVLAFNQLANPQDRFTDQQVASMGAKVFPSELAGQLSAPSFFGPEDRPVLLTRESGSVTFVLFSGAHEMFYEPGLRWFAQGAPSLG